MRRLITVLSVGASLTIASLVVLLLLTEGNGNGQEGLRQEQRGAIQEPGSDPWTLTGDFRVEDSGIGLSVLSATIRPDYTAILYAVDTGTVLSGMQPTSIEIDDGGGGRFQSTSNVLIGESMGVTAGLATFPAAAGEAAAWTVIVPEMSATTGERPAMQEGMWRIKTIQNSAPGNPVDYSFSTKVAPEIASLGDAIVGNTSGAQLRLVKLLLFREGRETAFYGAIDHGVGVKLTRDQYLADLQDRGFEEPPPPPGWPSQ